MHRCPTDTNKRGIQSQIPSNILYRTYMHMQKAKDRPTKLQDSSPVVSNERTISTGDPGPPGGAGGLNFLSAAEELTYSVQSSVSSEVENTQCLNLNCCDILINYVHNINQK